MARNFTELQENMSPESQARSQELINKYRTEIEQREKEVQSALRRALKEEVGDQEFPKDNKHAQAKFQMLRQKFGIIPPRYTESEREIING